MLANEPQLFLVNDVWVNEFHRKLQAKEISVRVMLDLTANQTIDDDPYMSLAREVKRQRGHVIDDPDVTATSAHKGRFHQMLLDNQIPVPETIVVNRSELDNFRITDEMKARLGTPFVVKPAWGDSGVGVVVDAQSEDALRWSAEQTPNSDSFLVQKRLQPKELGSHMGWFRLFHFCREVIPCWWDPATHEYQLVTPAQIRKYKLNPLRRIMRNIARVSRMRKFTSEVCLHEHGNFYAIDYVNADPDMNPSSFIPTGCRTRWCGTSCGCCSTRVCSWSKRDTGSLMTSWSSRNQASIGWRSGKESKRPCSDNPAIHSQAVDRICRCCPFFLSF